MQIGLRSSYINVWLSKMPSYFNMYPLGNLSSFCPEDKVTTYEPAEVIVRTPRRVGPKLTVGQFECDICEGFHGNSALNLAVHKFREHGEDYDAKKNQL